MAHKEHPQEFVILNNDPEKLYYFTADFKKKNNYGEKSSIGYIKYVIENAEETGVKMTPNFLKLVQKYTPDLYELASTFPMLENPETYVPNLDPVVAAEYKKRIERIGKKVEVNEEINKSFVEKSLDILETTKQKEDIKKAEELDTSFEEQPDPDTGFKTPTMVNKKYDDTTIKLLERVMEENKKFTTPRRTPFAKSKITRNPKSFSITPDSSATPAPAPAPAPVSDPVPDPIPDPVTAPVSAYAAESSQQHFPKYHLNSILFFFGSVEKPEYDMELQHNVFSSNLTREEIILYSDSIIKNYGSMIFVYKRISESIDEFHELIQLQFCYIRNLARGNRTKTAMVPISSLIDFGNALSGNTSTTSTTSTTSNPSDNPNSSPNPLGDNPAPPSGSQQVQITPNEAAKNVVEAYRSQKIDQYGKPVIDEDIVKSTLIFHGNTFGPNDPKKPMASFLNLPPVQKVGKIKTIK